jgi:LPXTG-site transpeptidase (sortase) family protein
MIQFWLDWLKRNCKLLIALGVVIIGLYVLATTLGASLSSLPPIQQAQRQAIYRKLNASPGVNGDRLYIPSVGIDVAIVEGADASALNGGAWHRQPQNGNPIVGGNFVLSAHRFQLGRSPQGTLKRSPFYKLNEVQTGSKIWVDYHNRRYEYIVTSRYSVKPQQTEIESASETTKLTLYSCSLRGATDGREVIEAVPSGTVVY